MDKVGVRMHMHAITVVCTDQRRTARFYCQGLGAMPVAGDSNLPPTALDLDGLRLMLLANAERAKPSTWPHEPAFALWLEVDDLESAYAQVLNAGAKVLAAPDDSHFEVTDPDGNPIEVWLRGA